MRVYVYMGYKLYFVLYNDYHVLSKYLIIKLLYNIFSVMNYNHGHNIMRIFNVLPNFPLTTSETKPDY